MWRVSFLCFLGLSNNERRGSMGTMRCLHTHFPGDKGTIWLPFVKCPSSAMRLGRGNSNINWEIREAIHVGVGGKRQWHIPLGQIWHWTVGKVYIHVYSSHPWPPTLSPLGNFRPLKCPILWLKNLYHLLPVQPFKWGAVLRSELVKVRRSCPTPLPVCPTVLPQPWAALGWAIGGHLSPSSSGRELLETGVIGKPKVSGLASP
jgi:hypothetical protein